ncbi:MAG: Lrp/AsnC ligand binding domain-containing protein [bacterium]
MKAYVLIKVIIGTSETVVEEMRQISGVREVSAITGPFDAIALLEAPNPAEIATLVISRLQKIEGVKDTLTCFALSS